MKILQCYQKWRCRREWKLKYPDPLIVCPLWRSCSHVDGMLCDPRRCNMLDSHDDLTEYREDEGK